LERLAASDVRRLDRMLHNEDEGVRAKAVKALGKLHDLRSLDLLLRAYGDPSERVSRAVVKALAKREGERAYSILIAAAAGGNLSALRALERHPVKEAVPALIEALDSPWSEVYGAALRALRVYVDVFAEDAQAMSALQETVPDLVALLNDESPDVRRLALETIGAFRGPRLAQERVAALPDIVFMLTDPKREIRLAAVQALEAIGTPEAAAALQAGISQGPGAGASAEDESQGQEELHQAIAEALTRMEQGSGYPYQ
jgi:HEAT repeat protein